MIRACEKRPVPLAELERIADEVEQELQNGLDREITTEHIGELVMEKLRGLDQVAYVRFASVYRQFKDIDTFMRAPPCGASPANRLWSGRWAAVPDGRRSCSCGP